MNAKTSHPSHGSIKRDVEKWTLRVTIASTVVAIVATGAAFWSSYEAHQTRIRDERPFLAVSVDPPSPTDFIMPGSSLGPGPRTHITGFGKSPAQMLSASCKAYPAKKGDTRKWKDLKSTSSMETFFYIIPTRSIEIVCDEEPNPNGEPGDPYREMGVVTYQDDAGRNYQTPFCFTIIVPPLARNPLIHECEEDYGLPELK